MINKWKTGPVSTERNGPTYFHLSKIEYFMLNLPKTIRYSVYTIQGVNFFKEFNRSSRVNHLTDRTETHFKDNKTHKIINMSIKKATLGRGVK